MKKFRVFIVLFMTIFASITFTACNISEANLTQPSGIEEMAETETVYITEYGEKYHHSNCRYLKESVQEISLIKAKEYAYTACSVCKP